MHAMKHIRQNFFSFKTLIPWVDLGVGTKAKIKLFRNMVILHINFKGTNNTADVSKYSVLVHMLDPLVDVKTFFFLKVVM